MNIFDTIIIAILLALSVSLLIYLIILKMKNNKLIISVSQLIVDKQILSDELDRASFVINNSSTIEDDFIKFLSGSRDGAYEYIEDVQEAILALSESMAQDDTDKIDNAYRNLMSFLPSENIKEVDK